MSTRAAPAPAIQLVLPASPMQKLGAGLMLVYLFIAHSRVLDVTVPFLHIPALLTVATMIALVVSNALPQAFSSSIVRLLAAFTVWMALSTPFSYWRGGSVDLLVNHWLKAFFVAIAIAGLFSTTSQCLKAARVLAFATAVIGVTALKFGVSTRGRLELPRGTYGNPNDLAMGILFGISFWWFLIYRPGRTLLGKLALAACTVPFWVALLKTGSRGGFLALLAIAMVLFLRSTLADKIKLIFVAVILLCAAVAFLPKNVLNRYFTFFSSSSIDDEDLTAKERKDLESAVGSAHSRRELLMDSIAATFRHPFFGVGPGMFAAATAETSADAGKRPKWQVTHNTYTQVSSEEGLPALLFYVAAMVCCWRALTRLQGLRRTMLHTNSVEIADLALALKLSLLSFAMFGCFASLAYNPPFLVLAGLTAALARATQVEIEERRLSPQTAPAQPVAPACRRPQRAVTTPRTP